MGDTQEVKEGQGPQTIDDLRVELQRLKAKRYELMASPEMTELFRQINLLMAKLYTRAADSAEALGRKERGEISQAEYDEIDAMYPQLADEVMAIKRDADAFLADIERQITDIERQISAMTVSDLISLFGDRVRFISRHDLTD